MALSKHAIPSLSEYQCQICLEILIEPVTLPCNHTLCKPCFLSTMEKANLCCPFCRLWVSSWTRYHTRRNSLVNMELWEMIQKHYPKECQLRISGQESEKEVEDYQPVRVLSTPGELRKEYEEEMSKMEAERRAREEEQCKASEEYIQKLLAEEEELEKKTRRRQSDLDLKKEEQARNLSANSSSDGSILASPLNSAESEPVATKSQKKRKNKQRHIEDRYLSPLHQFEPASQSEVVREVRKIYVSKNMDSDGKSPMQQEIEENMPTVSSRIGLEIKKQGAKSSMETPVPLLYVSGMEKHLEGKAQTSPSCCHKELFVVLERLKPGAHHSIQAAVKPYGKAQSKSTTPKTGNNTFEKQKGSHLLISKNIAKRKNEESSSEAVNNPRRSAKRELFQKSPSDEEESEVSFTQKMMTLEHQLFERHKQEEEDRLLAIQLQKSVDKQEMYPNRQKGSPDGYPLRAASSSPSNLVREGKSKKKSPEDKLT
ncbi:E3 ubiquitin-protein ligase RNF168-like [Marmota marmota marmota]|uniref:E3 ubiquitin-protein ligase RNF168-like n=1 Tax=Marmota marmota marmota TaxID=9994 RepID=UPI0020931287|nr:E3 ubiquitin-protein ligase RNF168-like [Marmota marmota marmota]